MISGVQSVVVWLSLSPDYWSLRNNLDFSRRKW